jgi:hypothetical protein
MNVPVVLWACVVFLSIALPKPAWGQPQATVSITGVVLDRHGGPLPGVTISVVTAGDAKTVTAADGRYTLSALPVGSHTVRAMLAGFGWGEERVDLRSGSVAIVDFVLCPLPQRFISFIGPPPKLSELFALATVAAHVRVTASEPSEGDCRGEARVTAALLETLKSSTPSTTGQGITFWQEQWTEEPAPYPAGAELIVFLCERQGELWRSHGPFAVFLVENGRTKTSKFLAYRRYVGMPVEEFLRELRAMQR